ncbi:MAG TPA: hypothetical protein VLD40_02205 [Dissulfurispiraceae bacterium]|nr:hypothetical protein [Dissulfurispiraceae bacterium]
MRKINMVYLIAVLAICALPMFSFGEMVEENDLYRLSAKGVPWWMQFPKSDYKLKSKRRNPDGKSDYYMFSSDAFINSISFSEK